MMPWSFPKGHRGLLWFGFGAIVFCVAAVIFNLVCIAVYGPRPAFVMSGVTCAFLIAINCLSYSVAKETARWYR